MRLLRAICWRPPARTPARPAIWATSSVTRVWSFPAPDLPKRLLERARQLGSRCRAAPLGGAHDRASDHDRVGETTDAARVRRRRHAEADRDGELDAAAQRAYVRLHVREI